VGVTVRDMDTRKGVSTNVEGEFQLPVSSNRSSLTLLFSYIGKVELEMKNVDPRKSVVVVMEDDGHVLDDVVVTGYQTLSRERATGSFGKIGQEILSTRPTSDLSSALQGVVAGMYATEASDGSVSYLIRGTSSLYADITPLIVVDGFPIQGTFSSINPNDVESVTVLKDAAAASIWGARSANGVIVVTTKKGQKGKLKVEGQGFFRINASQDLDYALSQADSRTTVDLELMVLEKGWAFPYSQFSGDIYSDILKPTSLAKNYYYSHKFYGMSEAEMNTNLERLRNTSNRQQIKDLLMQTQTLQQYNVNVSAGSDKYSTYASLMYEKNAEQTVRRGYERYMLNFNNSYKFNSWLTGTIQGTFQRKTQNNSGITVSQLAIMSPYEMILNEDGSYADQVQGFNLLTVQNSDLSNLPYSDLQYNVLREIQGRDYKTRTTRYRVNLGLNAKIWRGLMFDTKYQFERNEQYTRNYDSDDTFEVRYLVNTNADFDLANNVLNQTNVPLGGIIQQRKSHDQNWVWRNQLSYNETFDKHDIMAIAGMEMSAYKTSSTTYPYVLGYDPEYNTSTAAYYGSYDWVYGIDGYMVDVGYLNETIFADRIDKYMSFFGNIGYMYDNRYGASFSIRSDGSNYVTKDKSLRWSPMWSAGLKWNATREKFMSETKDWLDHLTVRATYGINGNTEKSTSTQTLINTQMSLSTSTMVSTISSFGNPMLRWEETFTTNLGLDFSLFKGMLSGKIDYYDRLGKYIVGTVTVPTVYGTSTQTYNNAEIMNRGVEVELSGNFKIKPIDLGITSTVTFAYNDNKVKKLYYPDIYCYEMAAGTHVEGYPVGALFSYEYAGLNDEGVPQVKAADGNVCAFNDLQMAYYTLGKDNMTYSGTSISPYTLGWTNHFSWKGFNLYVYLTGKFGGVFRRPTVSGVPTGGKGYVYSFITDLMNSDGTDYPTMPAENDMTNYLWSRYLPYLQSDIRSSSFIKLKEIDLSYTVPTYLVRKIHLTGLKVFVQARDLGLLYTANKEGYDPEWLPGIGYKPSASITFGLNVSL